MRQMAILQEQGFCRRRTENAAETHCNGMQFCKSVVRYKLLIQL